MQTAPSLRHRVQIPGLSLGSHLSFLSPEIEENSDEDAKVYLGKE